MILFLRPSFTGDPLLPPSIKRILSWCSLLQRIHSCWALPQRIYLLPYIIRYLFLVLSWRAIPAALFLKDPFPALYHWGSITLLLTSSTPDLVRCTSFKGDPFLLLFYIQGLFLLSSYSFLPSSCSFLLPSVQMWIYFRDPLSYRIQSYCPLFKCGSISATSIL